MPIYTKKGDEGKTSLPGGKTTKSDLKVEALGNLDELNSFLGYCVALSRRKWLKDILTKIQNQIFRVLSEIALIDVKKIDYINPINEEDVLKLEKAIDKLEKNLTPLNKFILPQGARDSAALHFARTICRRAERSIVRLNEKEVLHNKTILKFINRLSDFLFVLARYSNKVNNTEDIFPDYYQQIKK